MNAEYPDELRERDTQQCISVGLYLTGGPVGLRPYILPAFNFDKQNQLSLSLLIKNISNDYTGIK